MEFLSSFGSGIGTNFVSDSLARKLNIFKSEKAVKDLIQHFQNWEIEFEKQNDGTIVTNGAFFSYIKNHNVIENVVNYVLSPDMNLLSENAFLDELHSKMVKRIEEDSSTKLQWKDTRLIHDFLTYLFKNTRSFLFERLSLEDQGLLYMLCQNHAKLEELKNLIQEKFQLPESVIVSVSLQLFDDLKRSETEELIKNKIMSWNSRQIRNLGSRYTPDLNISLEIMEALHGATITTHFVECFLDAVDNFLISMRSLHIKEIETNCLDIVELVSGLDFFQICACDIEKLEGFVDSIELFLSNKIEEYYSEYADHGKKQNLNSKVYELHQKLGQLTEFKDYLMSETVQAAVSPYVLLTGDGGTGKSHLIADYIETQTESGKISLLLLGQQFSADTDVVSKLPNLIGCDITYHELFNMLEAIACNQQNRVLICVDALNEGAGVTLWNGILGGLIEFLKGYPHIGLLVSVRTQYEGRLFDGHEDLQTAMIRVEHTGFSTLTYHAIHEYFSFYGITTNSTIFPDTEFSNPLFLRLFCIANSGQYIDLDNISLPTVYSQYIGVMEQRVAERCGYHKSYKLVQKIISSMISGRVDESNGAVMLSVENALKIIVEICKQWNVNCDLYGSLLAEGVLTQGIDYAGKEYVYITYERLEDYFLAEKIVDEYSLLPEDMFFDKYVWILYRPDLLQFFGIVLAESWEHELSDIFSSDKPQNKYSVRNAFLYGLLWRKSSSITKRTVEYINSEILPYEHSFSQFIDVLFAVSARPNHRLNALHSFNFFMKFEMPDRDAAFVPVFDKLYSDSTSALYRLIEWGCMYSREQSIPDSIAENYALILCWLLISPNNELRDRATKAIICILTAHTESLISVMKKFEKIDDPYISERVFAVAFGCVVNEQDSRKIKELAQYVYNSIFNRDEVYPNILLRTFAKNIVDYAYHQGCLKDTEFSLERISPPYNSTFPNIPSDEDIKKYKLDYESETFEKHHWSQIDILSSMKVEYSRSGRPGGYGDFGRYTFQAYFHNWPQLHPMDLKNIAVKRIFDLGYDVEKHGQYDRNCTNNVMVGTQPRKRERIGKKYQWIALYELAAQVSDHYTMTTYDNGIGQAHQKYCKGSFEPDIRNIDPTVLSVPKPIKPCSSINAMQYVIPDNSYEEWLTDFALTPSFEQCIRIHYENQAYLLLAGEYDWKEAKKLGVRSYDLPRKNMWHQIRGYIVKNEHADDFLSAIFNVDFMGCWMPEAHSNYSMYNKEYYWSDAYEFFKDPYYCGSQWVNLDSSFLNSPFLEEVLVPVTRYCSERKGELNNLSPETSSIYWYKPCEEIFNNLKLQYQTGSNNVLLDCTGELICFDSSELFGVDTGFFIRQDKLCEFLESNGYTLFWTSLTEKRILCPSHSKWDLPPKAIHLSAVYQMKSNYILKKCESFFEDRLYF